MSAADLLLPGVLLAVSAAGLAAGRPIFDDFCAGAREGIKTVAGILPALLGIMVAVGMLRASGCLTLVQGLLSPLVRLLGIPEETLPLMLLRPISGTGSLAVFRDILAEVGPDSFAGRVASVMQGSTETTFYTLALYYGVTHVRHTRHTLPAAMAGDLTGFLAAALTVRLLMGG